MTSAECRVVVAVNDKVCRKFSAGRSAANSAQGPHCSTPKSEHLAGFNKPRARSQCFEQNCRLSLE